MRIIRNLKYSLEDILHKVCMHKWRFLFCVISALLGTVLGVVFVSVFKYSWWYENRYSYALNLFGFGFGLFFAFLLWTAVFYLCVVLCSMFPQTKYLSCAVLLVACLYCGANTAAAVLCWSVWGILFACLVTFAEVMGYLVSVALICNEQSMCRTFKEALMDSKQAFGVLFAAFLTKIIAFFVILHIITAVI